MKIDFMTLLWIFFMIAALQPILRQRMLDSARQRLIAAIEKKRNSRVITLVHRQETMSLLGFPIMKYITRSVWILSMVSLLTDTASEMLYPVMPIYLKTIGFTVVLIGILEGLAEATAGLSKGYFGKLSDGKYRSNERNGRNDCIYAGSVRQACINIWTGFINTTAKR